MKVVFVCSKCNKDFNRKKIWRCFECEIFRCQDCMLSHEHEGTATLMWDRADNQVKKRKEETK